MLLPDKTRRHDTVAELDLLRDSVQSAVGRDTAHLMRHVLESAEVSGLCSADCLVVPRIPMEDRMESIAAMQQDPGYMLLLKGVPHSAQIENY